ncbi:MAG TPA: redoxin domain-containing protein, partial [Blastocatellia bacterium]
FALAFFLPAAEMTIALALVPAATARLGAIAALALLVLFSAVILINLVRGRAHACHCFGQLGSAPIGRKTIIRNLVLIALAALVAWGREDGAMIGVESWLFDLPAPDRARAIIALAGLGLAGLMIAMLARILKQQRQLATRIDVLEDALDEERGERAHRDLVTPSRGLPVGAPAPGFLLPDLEGKEIALDDLLGSGTRLLLLFVNTSCSPCSALLPDVEALRQKYSGKLSFAVLSRGSAQENRSTIARHVKCPVLLDPGSEVFDDFRSRWMPSAVVIDGNKSIASRLASGYEEVIELIDHAASGTARPWTGAEERESAGLEMGAPAPDFSLPDTDGRKVSLSDFQGSRVLLIFWSAECGFCIEMLDELREYESGAQAGDAKLLLITRGKVDGNQTLGLRSPTLLDPNEDVFKAFGATGTPSAVLISERGLVASFLAAGAEDVLALAGIRKTRSRVSAALSK